MATSLQTSVFVSTVYRELISYRMAALDAVWRSDLYPLGMERADFAMPFSTSESSRRMVDEAAVYIGIFSHRYGVVTTEEFRRAEERGLPILPFIASKPLSSDDHEPDPERARLLEELKEELRLKYVVATFTSPEELGTKVLRALVALRKEGILPRQKTDNSEKLVTSTTTIFVSYRREDTTPTCLHLVYRLEQHFGVQAVYMDEGAIPPGADWREHIKEAVAKCGVMLALIGPMWLAAVDDLGQRRLDDDNDILRQEIETALRRRIPVIPVLVDHTPLPRAQELPQSLEKLRDRQSLRLRNSKSDFGNDAQHIIQATEHWISVS